MAPPAKKGDQDTFNFGPGMCWQYPPDTLTEPQESVTVKAGGQPLVLHSPLLPPLTNAAWTGVCGPIPQPAPPQPRVIISGVNRKVQAEGRLIAVIGDKTNPPGFLERFIIGPGLVNSRVSIC
jgi:hypothetical protein